QDQVHVLVRARGPLLVGGKGNRDHALPLDGAAKFLTFLEAVAEQRAARAGPVLGRRRLAADKEHCQDEEKSLHGILSQPFSGPFGWLAPAASSTVRASTRRWQTPREACRARTPA